MATLTSTKIKNTYDALLKASDNDAIGSSAKQITDGLGNGTPLYISTTQIGIGVTPEATYDLHVYQNAKVGGNLTITGDLTVNGTTTTVDTDTLRVEDPLIEVARNNTSSDAVDIGIYGKYAPSGTTLYAGLFRDTGDDKFKLFKSLEEQPTTTVNTSGTGYAVATLVANVEGTLTGIIASTTTATTQSANDNSTKVATTAYVDNQVGLFDTLSEVLANGNTTGGTKIEVDNTSGGIDFIDDAKLRIGTDNDLSIYHSSSNSFIDADLNNLYLRVQSTDSDMFLQSDDGSGGLATYVFLDGSTGAVELNHYGSKKLETTSTGVTVTGAVSATTFSGQLDGTISSATTATTQTQGDNSTKVATTAYVDSIVTAQDLDFAGDSGTGAVDLDSQTFTIAGTSNEIETSASGQTLTVGLPDDVTVTGNLTVNGTGISLSNATNPTITVTDSTNGHYLTMQGLDGASKIDYLSTLIFEYGAGNTEAARLTSSGLTITEELTVSGTGQSSFAGQVTIPATPSASTDAASKGYVDSQVGANNELSEVLANGNTTGGTDIAVSANDDITFTDSSKAIFGDDSDLEIYHDGSKSVIADVGTGALRIAGTNFELRNADQSKFYMNATDGGAINLYYNNSKKLETTNTGINVTGGITGDDSVFIEGNTNPNFTAHDITNETYTSLWSGDTEAALTFNHSLFRITSSAYNFTGTDLVTITSGGDVGIGVSPSYKLDIAGTSPRIRVAETTSNTANTMVEVENSDGRGAMLGIGGSARTDILANRGYINAQSETDGLAIGTEGTDPILFYTQGVATSNERMRIDSSGKVIVSNSGATNIGILQLSSSVTSYFLRGGANYGYLSYHTGGYHRWFGSDGAEDMRLNSTGLGIGTTSPAVSLDVNSGTSDTIARFESTDNRGRIQIDDNDTTVYAIAEGSKMSLGTSNTLSSTNLTIDSSGNVGIGTTTPNLSSSGTALTVNSSSGANAAVEISDGGTLAGLLWGRSGTGVNVWSIPSIPLIFGTANAEKMRIDNSGNLQVGDGTISAAGMIHAYKSSALADLVLQSAGGSGRAWRFVSDTDGKFYIRDNNAASNRLYIDTSGNVGIGATDPVKTLDVRGQLAISNNASSYWYLDRNDSTGNFEILTDGNSSVFNIDTSGNSTFAGSVSITQNSGSLEFSNTGSGHGSITTGLSKDLNIGAASGNVYINNNTTFSGNLDSIDGKGYRLKNAANSANEGGFLRSGLWEGNSDRDPALFAETGLGLRFYTGGSATERMVINSSGNVGINYTTPFNQISGANETTLAISNSNVASLYLNNTATNGHNHILFSGTGGALSFYDKTRGDYNMVIDSSGQVGIGVTSPSTKLDVRNDDGVGNGLHLISDFSRAGGADAQLILGYFANGSAVTGPVVYAANGYPLLFSSGSVERMRINSDGDVLMNCTSVPSGSGGGAAFETAGTLMRLKQSSPTTSTTKVQIYYNANGEVGSIHTSGTATAFNTSSDYRLKDDYKDFNGLDLVNNINVYDFEWKSDKTRSYGVKAHELQEVIPQAVNGEKDGEQMQQVDYSKLVPILLKSIQELQERIQILENN